MVKSGPAMAPLAGLSYAQSENLPQEVLIVDTGGTTFDVSLVRNGEIKYTRETWLGAPYTGHNVGMASVDVRSVGAGGGSIAWVDSGGLLQVGPRSAGAMPGPACYAQGGTEPTVTDAALVLGYIDPEHFLNGRMPLDASAARAAIAEIAEPLGMSPEKAAFAVITIASETMIKAIEEITVNEGVNPRESVLVAGGGAAGLNILPIAKALGCKQVLLPKTAGALTAYGAQFSDIVTEFSASQFARSDHWAADDVNKTLGGITAQMESFADELRAKGITTFKSEFFVDARYANQQYETEIKMPTARFDSAADLTALVAAFNENHQRLYGVSEEDAVLECLNWKGRLTASLEKPAPSRARAGIGAAPTADRSTRAFFGDLGEFDAPVYLGATLGAGATIDGPAIIEEPTTTVVIYPGSRATVTDAGNYLLDVESAAAMLTTESDALDPVLLAVMANRMDAILREMTSIIVRTARSSVIGHSRDFSCAIVTADDQVLATAEGLPAHIFGSHLQTRSMRRLHPDFKEGDAYLHNDPYDGNSHAADHTVLVPVFADDGEHMFSVACKGHQADVGNSVPSTYVPFARDVYEEGAIIFPCVKVQENYREVDDIIRMCKRRIRIPDQWYGDHKSAMGAARIAETRLKDFVRRYGKALVKDFVTEWFDYSETRAKQSIMRLPKGKLVNRGRHDSIKPFMAEGVEIKVEIEIDPEQGIITVDLRDNPDCVDAGMNLTEATATVYGLQGVMHCLDDHVPPNAGSFRRLRVLLRENCVVGIPKFPHSCSVGTTNIGDLVVSLTQSAFTQLGDGYGLSQGNACFGGAMGVLAGTDWRRDHEPYVNEIYLQGGGGPASATTDGMVYLLLPAGAGLLWRDSVEFDEQRFPMFVECLRLIEDSCGAGRQRGGPATEMTYGPRVRADGSEEQLDNGVMVELQPDEWLKSHDCGGSGYGDPKTREPAKVLHDVRERYVSIEEAHNTYAVAITGTRDDDSLAVDVEATEALRTDDHRRTA
jgi:N-methylhydantoinase B